MDIIDISCESFASIDIHNEQERIFQYLTEKGVIRVWDETLFDDVVAKLSVLDKAENDD